MKRYLAFALVLVMLLGLLCGCQIKDNLTGTWECTIDLTDMINEEFGTNAEMEELGMSDFAIQDFSMKFIFSFHEDGSYTMEGDEDSANAAFESLKAQMADLFTKFMEDEIASNGVEMTVDELLSAMGMTMDELLDEAFSEDMITDLLDEVQTEGNYLAEKGKLYTTSDLDDEIDRDVYMTYELNGNTLRLLEDVGGDPDETFNAMLPLELKKVG